MDTFNALPPAAMLVVLVLALVPILLALAGLLTLRFALSR